MLLPQSYISLLTPRALETEKWRVYQRCGVWLQALQVEKEKYDQLMQKYQDQLKNKDSEAKLQVCSQVFFVSLNNNLKHIKKVVLIKI